MRNSKLSIYNKILILGSVASGKTTLGKALAVHNQSYFFELDNLIHIRRKTGDIRRNQKEINEILDRLYKLEAWIVEGVYREEYKDLLNTADCILIMDIPVWVREERIFARWVKQYYGYEASNYTPTVQMLTSMLKWNRDYEEKYSELKNKLKPHEFKVKKYSELNK